MEKIAFASGELWIDMLSSNLLILRVVNVIVSMDSSLSLRKANSGRENVSFAGTLAKKVLNIFSASVYLRLLRIVHSTG